MKIKKILLLTLSLISMFSCEKDEYDDINYIPENYRLIKVLNFSNSSKSEPGTFIDYKYSVSGNLQKESFYDYPNILFVYKTYDYDRNGLLKEKKIYDGQVKNLRLGTYVEYEYENGNLIKEELYLADGSLRSTVFYKYENSNLIHTYTSSNWIGIHNQSKYVYNELNVLILEEFFQRGRKLSSYTKYFYDADLRLTKTEIFNQNGSISYSVEYKYIKDDTVPTEEVYYDTDGNLTHHKLLTYDDFNNLIEAKIISNQVTNTLFRKKFNGKLLIEHISYSPNWGFEESYVKRYKYEKIK